MFANEQLHLFRLLVVQRDVVIPAQTNTGEKRVRRLRSEDGSPHAMHRRELLYALLVIPEPLNLMCIRLNLGFELEHPVLSLSQEFALSREMCLNGRLSRYAFNDKWTSFTHFEVGFGAPQCVDLRHPLFLLLTELRYLGLLAFVPVHGLLLHLEHLLLVFPRLLLQFIDLLAVLSQPDLLPMRLIC